jgi:hypothetical protein
MVETHSDQLVELARRRGILRTADLKEHGIPRVNLTRLVLIAV